MVQKSFEPPAPPPRVGTITAVSSVARSPYPTWFCSALLLAAIPPLVRAPLGFPHLAQIPIFSGIFYGTGYMIHAGDSLNGGGTTTAWSLIYLFFNAKRALVARKPLPLMLTGVLATNAIVYGYEYARQ